jgi:GNAT superfamily N-acetyltransferase
VRVSIVEEDAAALREYARVPISFSVRSVYDVSSSASGEIILTERELDTPVEKDYDSTSEGPTVWPVAFDISNWGFLAAFIDGARVGGAVVALRSRDLEMLDGRDDLAVLWDLRVAPDQRGNGVGGELIEAAERWARANGATTMKVETQNINVPACRRYARSGFIVRKANFGAYGEFPDEVQLLWYKELSSSSTGD